MGILCPRVSFSIQALPVASAGTNARAHYFQDRKDAMNRKQMLVVTMLGAASMVRFAALAMPTESELARLEPGVVAIVSDIEKRENGDPLKVAEALFVLEKDTEWAVERFLLRREAVLHYLKARKCEEAREVMARCAAEGDAIAVLAVDEYVNRRLTFKERSALKGNEAYGNYEQYVKEMVAAQKEKAAGMKRLKELEAAYAKDKTNVKCRNRLAMEYALTDQWKQAIPLLALSKGEIGDAARAEQRNSEAKGSAAVEIADLWWNVEGKKYVKALSLACRRHAAELYRVALTDQALPNLVKMRIGGRIEEIQEKSDDRNVPAPTVAKAPSGFPSVDVKGGELVRILVDAKGKLMMEMSACPPGEFVMDAGCTAPSDREHKVKLTYPYLIGRGHVTFGMVQALDRKMWKARMDEIRTDDEKFYPAGACFDAMTGSDIETLLKKLNSIAAKSPELKAYKGYEFRLPTEAEWVWAYRAGENDEDMEDISDDELKEYWRKRGGTDWKRIPPDQDVVDVIGKKPNSWGIHSMVRARDDLADTVAHPLTKQGKPTRDVGSMDSDVFAYCSMEENPIRSCTDKNACRLARKNKSRKTLNRVDSKGTRIRVVFGPKIEKLNVYPKKDTAGKK